MEEIAIMHLNLFLVGRAVLAQAGCEGRFNNEDLSIGRRLTQKVTPLTADVFHSKEKGSLGKNKWKRLQRISVI